MKRLPRLAASNITIYLKYTFPYLLNGLLYQCNSVDSVEIFPIIFANLYWSIEHRFSPCCSIGFKIFFSFLYFPGLICPFFIDSISYVPVDVYLSRDSVLKMLYKTQLAKTIFTTVSGTTAIGVKKNRNL